jgi:hypothetical protein
VGNAIANGDLPLRWGLQQEQGPQGGRRILWFGSRRIDLDDIQSITADEVRERPVSGLIMAAYIFLVVSMILAFGVFENGWRERFLLGTVFLAFLGTTGLYDSSTLKPVRFFEVKFSTSAHGVVTFSSSDEGEVRAFLAALAAAGVKA